MHLPIEIKYYKVSNLSTRFYKKIFVCKCIVYQRAPFTGYIDTHHGTYWYGLKTAIKNLKLHMKWIYYWSIKSHIPTINSMAKDMKIFYEWVTVYHSLLSLRHSWVTFMTFVEWKYHLCSPNVAKICMQCIESNPHLIWRKVWYCTY